MWMPFKIHEQTNCILILESSTHIQIFRGKECDAKFLYVPELSSKLDLNYVPLNVWPFYFLQLTIRDTKRWPQMLILMNDWMIDLQ